MENRKISIRRPRCRWEDNVKRDSKGIGSRKVTWNQLTQDSIVRTQLYNLIFPRGKIFRPTKYVKVQQEMICRFS